MTNPQAEATVLAIEKPHKDLWTYYLISSLAFLILFPFAALVLWFKYHTLRYKFTAEGLSMSWGILFRRETIINYARIQDIHLRSNLIERWLGLGRILVQTASGNSGAEMTIEGIKEFELVRDFLYSRMRGVSDPSHAPKAAASPASPAGSPDLVAALLEVAREIRETRRILEAREPGKEGRPHV
ncbi:MAG: PH domain-containing protein [Vicinamibacteria bacterium]|nr:PH domain-containing protein [Vicinamibacteria bacterium]